MSLSNIVEKPERRIKEWLDQFKKFRLSTPITITAKTGESVENQIVEAAYYLSLEKHSYDDLFWILAEKIQKKIYPTPTIEDIKEKAA
ncbi:MAG: hypothetical protein ACFFG0_15745 [Candidatus Thorarchaeota archaeon]